MKLVVPKIGAKRAKPGARTDSLKRTTECFVWYFDPRHACLSYQTGTSRSEESSDARHPGQRVVRTLDVQPELRSNVILPGGVLGELTGEEAPDGLCVKSPTALDAIRNILIFPCAKLDT